MPRFLDQGKVRVPLRCPPSVSESSRAGGVRQAPLAAGVLEDVGGRVALVPAGALAAAGGRRQVLSAAAGRETPHQVAEQVAGEEHVDPGVTAAVQTGQQHGDDEGHFWRDRQRGTGEELWTRA